MKKYLLLTILPFVANAAVYIDEGFEDNSFNPPLAYICDTPTPPGCTNTASIVTTRNSGSYSFRGVYNQEGAAGFFITESDYSTSFPNKSYLRYYFSYGSTFRSHERTKQIRWHLDGAPDLYINCNGMSGLGNESSGASSCDIGVYFGYDPSGACGWANDFYYIASPGNSWMTGLGKGVGWLVTSGSGWWYLEVMIDIPNRLLSLWMKRPGDATATQMFNNLSLAGCSNFNGNESFSEIDFGWMNSTAGGSGGPWYIDDVKVSNQYNGLVSGGVINLLLPPSNLRIME